MAEFPVRRVLWVIARGTRHGFSQLCTDDVPEPLPPGNGSGEFKFSKSDVYDSAVLCQFY